MIFDFTKRGKIYARKGAIFAKMDKVDEAIDWYGKSLIEDQNGNVLMAKK